jgi:hypothetical protein
LRTEVLTELKVSVPRSLFPIPLSLQTTVFKIDGVYKAILPVFQEAKNGNLNHVHFEKWSFHSPSNLPFPIPYSLFPILTNYCFQPRRGLKAIQLQNTILNNAKNQDNSVKEIVVYCAKKAGY